MQLVDAGMIAFAAWHALKGRVDRPLTFQVPRMLRPLVAKTEDTYALFWNAKRQWKKERWPAYRDRPEIWDHAGREDYEAMVEALSALGVVQFRADGREADEVLAAVAYRLEGEERLVLYDLHFNYHSAHHRWPQCPSRHLPLVHRLYLAGHVPLESSMLATVVAMRAGDRS